MSMFIIQKWQSKTRSRLTNIRVSMIKSSWYISSARICLRRIVWVWMKTWWYLWLNGFQNDADWFNLDSTLMRTSGGWKQILQVYHYAIGQIESSKQSLFSVYTEVHLCVGGIMWVCFKRHIPSVAVKRGLIYLDVTYSTAVTKAEHYSNF